MFYGRRGFRWRYTYPPPWWPEGEPWPPRSNLHLYERRPYGARGFRRMAYGGAGMVFWFVMLAVWFASRRQAEWPGRPGSR